MVLPRKQKSQSHVKDGSTKLGGNPVATPGRPQKVIAKVDINVNGLCHVKSE